MKAPKACFSGSGPTLNKEGNRDEAHHEDHAARRHHHHDRQRHRHHASIKISTSTSTNANTVMTTTTTTTTIIIAMAITPSSSLLFSFAFQRVAAWAARAEAPCWPLSLRVTALKGHTVRAHPAQNRCDFREGLRKPDLSAVSRKT